MGIVETHSVAAPGLSESSVFDTTPGAGADPLRTAAHSLVADYARAHGVRDPDLLARFARRCVAAALAEIGEESPSARRLEHGALGVAMDQLERHRLQRDADTLAGRNVAPAERPAVMPPQALGELHPVADPEHWKSLLQSLAAPARMAPEAQR